MTLRPLAKNFWHSSAVFSHASMSKKDTSSSARDLRLTATENEQIAFPCGVVRSSGSRVSFPMRNAVAYEAMMVMYLMRRVRLRCLPRPVTTTDRGFASGGLGEPEKPSPQGEEGA